MATVEISFISPVGIAPVDNANFSSAEILTSSGTSQVSTGASTGTSQVCAVSVSGSAIYVAFGTAPDAGTSGTRRLVPAGATRYFGGLPAGHKAAIIDVV